MNIERTRIWFDLGSISAFSMFFPLLINWSDDMTKHPNLLVTSECLKVNKDIVIRKYRWEEKKTNLQQHRSPDLWAKICKSNDNKTTPPTTTTSASVHPSPSQRVRSLSNKWIRILSLLFFVIFYQIRSDEILRSYLKGFVAK